MQEDEKHEVEGSQESNVKSEEQEFEDALRTLRIPQLLRKFMIFKKVLYEKLSFFDPISSGESTVYDGLSRTQFLRYQLDITGKAFNSEREAFMKYPEACMKYGTGFVIKAMKTIPAIEFTRNMFADFEKLEEEKRIKYKTEKKKHVHVSDLEKIIEKHVTIYEYKYGKK